MLEIVSLVLSMILLRDEFFGFVLLTKYLMIILESPIMINLFI
jgi:hypothetical protein